jgi:seryl-tRNA synthetase
MLDPRTVRSNPERLKQVIRLRKVDPAKADIDRWLELDRERHRLQLALEEANAERKRLAESARKDPETARAKGQELRQRVRDLEQGVEDVSKQWQAIFDWFPNWPADAMPEGAGEDDNVEECAWVPGRGYLAESRLGRAHNAAQYMPERPVHAGEADFKPRDHAELGQRLGIDNVQAGKVSGSRFAYILGDLARLQFAIQQLLMGKLLESGFQPIVPPLLVRERSLYGTSHFPEGRSQVYAIVPSNVEDEAELFLVGSSEPANFSYFMDKTLDEAQLPVKIFASTSCFRSEVGSWGKDVKGIKRVHQFDKIEMNSVCMPAQSDAIYAEFRSVNEWLMQTLELPYRIVDKCTGDAGYLASHRQRDIEVWMPGSGEFMEVMTDTNTTDYQARRLNIRYKPADGTSARFCHTVNDTGCALGRMIIAVLENYQQADGSVKVPAAVAAVMREPFIRPVA